jgi:hypothetical protein
MLDHHVPAFPLGVVQTGGPPSVKTVILSLPDKSVPPQVRQRIIVAITVSPIFNFQEDLVRVTGFEI